MSYCTKEPIKNLTSEESRIYVTNFDTSVNFSDYKTFRIADSIAVVTNNRLEGRKRTSDDVQIINAVAAAMEQRGFTRVSGNASADLGIAVNAITNTSTQVVSYRDYGGFYGGLWDPFYWGYPNYSYFFPTYYGVYETGETALSVDAVDIKNATQNNNRLRVVWSGLVRGSGVFTNQNIPGHITALFNQSPYLRNQ
jgi:hypothetical protein